MPMKAKIIFFLTLVFSIALSVEGDQNEEKPKWAKKDIRDFSDADMEMLYDQWEDNDDEPLPEDELPEYKRKPKEGAGLNLDNIGSMSTDEIMKMSKKGKTVMLFINIEGLPTKDESETLTMIWQGSLRNNHIQTERYVIDDNRALFLFHDGAQAWEAKDFLLDQEGVESITLEGQQFVGRKRKSKKSEETSDSKIEL